MESTWSSWIMGLPVSIKEFTKNPVSSIALLSLCAVIYLYLDLRGTMQEQIIDLKHQVEQLQEANKDLQRQYIELAKSIKWELVLYAV